MARHVFDLSEIVNANSRSPIAYLRSELAGLGLPLFIDHELVFQDGHFDGRDPFAFVTYAQGWKKEGTIRYKSGHLRVPAYPVLPAFEQREREANDLPRLIVQVPRIVIGRIRDLKRSEFKKAGFTDHHEIVNVLKEFYHDLTLDKIVTFYEFGRTRSRPTRQEVLKYLETHPQVS